MGFTSKWNETEEHHVKWSKSLSKGQWSQIFPYM
jgi:hypothetical protein